MFTDSSFGGASVTQTGLDELIDELPLGVLFLGQGGSLKRANPVGRQLLDGFVGVELERLLVQMTSRAIATGHLVEAVMSAGALGELRILLATAASGGGAGFIAFIERSATTRLRAEIQILRTLLTCLTVRESPRDALEPGLASLAGTLASGYVILFELDPATQMLSALTHVAVPAEHQSMLLPHQVGPLTSSVGRAVQLGAPVHLSQLSRAPFRLERSLHKGEGCSGLALPVRNGKETLGAIFVCAPVGMLGEGELRLVQGLADTLGALIDRARQDDLLRREQRARQSLMDNLPDAVVESTGGVISLAGGRVQPILGRTVAELVGTQVADLLVPGDREAFAEKVRAGASATTPPIAQVNVQQPGNKLVPVEVSLQRVSGEEGGPMRAVFRDVSERKALEADMQRAKAVAVQREKMALIGQLAASITHEINNPLAFVRSNLEVIGSVLTGNEGEKAPSPHSARLMKECVLESLQGLDRVSTIIHALKKMAKRRSSEVVEFDAAAALREAVLIFERAKLGTCTIALGIGDEAPAVQSGLETTAAGKGALPAVLGSPGGLSQVLLNLMDNALDAMGGNGRLEITARHTDTAVEIRVRDHGPGIAEEARAHLFEPYFSTKDDGKGSGLGLYLSKEILESGGGSLTYETGPEGTTFVAALPLVGKKAA
jgi:PAS domain S-box-containing protein